MCLLQGNTLDRGVHLRLTKDVGEKRVVWKLKRNILGLKDSKKAWYEKAKSEMKRFGATISKFDKAVFISMKKS